MVSLFLLKALKSPEGTTQLRWGNISYRCSLALYRLYRCCCLLALLVLTALMLFLRDILLVLMLFLKKNNEYSISADVVLKKNNTSI